jgi:hypothetical protein
MAQNSHDHDNSRTVVRLFTGLANDEEEEWLSKMDADGWRLAKRGWAWYVFTKHPVGERATERPIYRMDFWPHSSTHMDDYIAIARDAGWEHVLDYNGWHYFRHGGGAGEFPEILSDRESQVAKYRRILRATMALWIPASVVMLINLSRLNRTAATGLVRRIYVAGWWGSAAVLALMGCQLIRMWVLLRRLEKRYQKL